MDRQQTSFIPKKTLVVTEQKPVAGKTPFQLVPFLLVLIFLGSGFLSAGVFLYDRLLTSTLNSKKETLRHNMEAFEPATIKEIQRLDRRLRASSEIIGNHMALSNLFAILERSTLPTVRFDNFAYSASDEKGKATLSMRGAARSYGSVVSQSDTFGAAKGIKNPVFSDLNLDQQGNVVFSLSAELDPSVLKYSFVLPLVSTDTSTTTTNGL